MLRYLWLLLFVAGLNMPSVFAQESALAPQHKKLQEMEGTWSFTLKMGEGDETKGECVYKMECGGLWLTSDFRTDFNGAKYQGKGLDGYDTNKKKYVSVWVDSMTTAPMFFEGDYDAKGEKLTMHSKGPGPEGKPGVWRSVSTTNQRDKHVFEMFFKPEGGEETQMMTVIYTRQSK